MSTCVGIFRFDLHEICDSVGDTALLRFIAFLTNLVAKKLPVSRQVVQLFVECVQLECRMKRVEKLKKLVHRG